MKKIAFLMLCLSHLHNTKAQSLYSEYPVYKGKDLGLSYTSSAAAFRIWSPPATAAELLLYKEGEGGSPYKTIALSKGKNGTWYASVKGNLKGSFYAFRVKINEQWNNEVPDPYAKAAGINGKRAMVIDLKETNPAGWLKDKSPAFSSTNQPTDAIIYELHIRDASIHNSSGIIHKGKFSGLAETGTKTKDGLTTGLDHLKELGVTHIHLLPFYDYNSVDEKNPEKAYNWGYDPVNYNIPEGSYSTNPYDGNIRIKELKQMVSTFHKNGLRVIMDVVYNHTALTGESNFNQLVPGYYYRHKKDGSFSDATACGNETASEMPMMRKFMLESVVYWVKEYHIDGFRFDLMGVHDIETMNLIADTLHKIKPGIVLYGEGWTAGASPLPDSLRALKQNAAKLRGVAVFSDDIRDGIKGSVFELADRGFASGKPGMEESVKFGIAAACQHSQVDYSKVNYSKQPYAAAPSNVITYCECHDNHVLWDKLALSFPTSTEKERIKMQQLALTIVLTSQGTPFLHAGTEFLRSKQGVENSYNAGDSINAIDWNLKKEHIDVYHYVQQLIKLRKAHPAFRMTTSAQIEQNIRFEKAPEGTIIYSINGSAVKDKWKTIWVAFNGSGDQQEVSVPDGKWKVAIDSNGENTLANMHNGHLHLKATTAIILYQE